MPTKLVISLDSSTTAVKAIAWDRNGRAVAEGRATYPLLQPAPTWYEQNAEQWWSGACAAIRECVAQIDVRQVEALGITHQRESFVQVDAAGRAIRNAILWLDERTRAQVKTLEQRFGRAALHQRTGKMPSLTPALPKLLWLVEHEPDIVTRTAKFLDVHAFLNYHLTGVLCTSTASADPMGLLDMVKQAWADDLIEAIGLRPDQFVEVVPPGTVIGGVNQAAANATGLPAGLPVVAGGGDGQCAGLGANAVGNGRVYLNLGTAVVSGAFSTTYVADHAFRTLNAPLAGAYFFETLLRGGVFTVSWFVEKFANDLRQANLPLSPEAILEADAARVPPGALGLMAVPYWCNVTNPYWDPAATGITIGWTGSHSREHFYRAILEGVAFEQRLAGEGLAQAIRQPLQEYVVMGGGSRSNLWLQIVADVTGTPVVRSATTEATCLGAAIVAATAVGWYNDAYRAAAGMTNVTDRFTPNPTTQAIYEPLYQEVYKPLFPTVQTLVDRLTELTDGNNRQST